MYNPHETVRARHAAGLPTTRPKHMTWNGTAPGAKSMREDDTPCPECDALEALGIPPYGTPLTQPRSTK